VGSWTFRTKFQAHRDHISALQFAPDGTLFTGSFDATVLAWNVRPDKAVEDTPLSKAWRARIRVELSSVRAWVRLRLPSPSRFLLTFVASRISRPRTML